MAGLWKKLDTSQDIPFHVTSQDEIFYAREYISEGGYEASEANSLIINFKKDISRKGKPEWYYKEQAIRKFALELGRAVMENAVLAAIPSSIWELDPKYDSRMDDMLAQAKGFKPSLILEKPFVANQTTTPSHHGGTRNPQEIYDNLVWRGFSQPTNLVLLVDDVLTSGAHFRACKRLIQEHHPNVRVVGVFWAKTVWPDAPELDVQLSPDKKWEL